MNYQLEEKISENENCSHPHLLARLTLEKHFAPYAKNHICNQQACCSVWNSGIFCKEAKLIEIQRSSYFMVLSVMHTTGFTNLLWDIKMNCQYIGT
jgi:hypothetical protein